MFKGHLQVAIAAFVVTTMTKLIPVVSMRCSNPPPGVPRMIRGVDITELDLLPLDEFGSVNDGFKNPVVNFTCNQGRTWRSPRGGEYQLPDQVWHMNSLPGGYVEADTKIYKTHSDVRKSMSRNVGGGLDILKFSFSASVSYKKMQSTIQNTSRIIADVGAYDSATQIDFIPSWRLQLDSFAKDYVERLLPSSFEDNPFAYNTFIEEFGTHYFDSANFGGYIRVVNEVNSAYYSSTSEKTVEVQAKASFFKIIKANGGSVSSSTTVDERFTQSSTTTTRYFGGYINLLTASGIEKWQPTIYSDPWLFSGDLKPISYLIADERKKVSMDKAVTTYILKRYLEELERLLAKMNTRDSEVTRLRSTLEELKQRTVLEEAEVQELGQEIESRSQVQTPACRRVLPIGFRRRQSADITRCDTGTITRTRNPSPIPSRTRTSTSGTRRVAVTGRRGS